MARIDEIESYLDTNLEKDIFNLIIDTLRLGASDQKRQSRIHGMSKNIRECQNHPSFPMLEILAEVSGMTSTLSDYALGCLEDTPEIVINNFRKKLKEDIYEIIGENDNDIYNNLVIPFINSETDTVLQYLTSLFQLKENDLSKDRIQKRISENISKLTKSSIQMTGDQKAQVDEFYKVCDKFADNLFGLIDGINKFSESRIRNEFLLIFLITQLYDCIEKRNEFLTRENNLLNIFPGTNEIQSLISTQLLNNTNFQFLMLKYTSVIAYSILQLLNSIAYFYDFEFNQDENNFKELVPYTLQDIFSLKNEGMIFKEFMSAFEKVDELWKDSEFQKSVEIIDHAIEIGPKCYPFSALLLMNKGIAYQNSGKHWEAVDCYEESILHRNYLHFPHSNLSIIYRDLGFNQKAIDCATKATEGWPNEGATFYILGLALEKAEKNKQAKEAFAKAKSLGYNA
jgi:tetratricopeptide (TPR) repeat protein